MESNRQPQHTDRFATHPRSALRVEPPQPLSPELASPTSAISPIQDYHAAAPFNVEVDASSGSALDAALSAEEDGPGRKPSTGPRRSSSGLKDKEKRKRSRVTPEQLVQLEEYFASDRSPTAARRREISETLGMQERQTQIWFQNRRAKAKNLDTKLPKSSEPNAGAASEPTSEPASIASPTPELPPKLTTGFEAELHELIHEDEPVTIIPCTDLTIGSWRRIAFASDAKKHDLVAYVSAAKRCLTWYIHSRGFGFKMEIMFDTIISKEFRHGNPPGTGIADFTLSQAPIFYLESTSSPRPDGSAVRYWKRCLDWTEGRQASTVLRHTLVGSADQLAHVLHNLIRPLQSGITAPSSQQSLAAVGNPVAPIPVQPPMPTTTTSYPQSEEHMSPMEQSPQPPLAGLDGAALQYFAQSGHGLQQANIGAMKHHQLDRIDTRRGPSSFVHMESGYHPVDPVSGIIAPRGAGEPPHHAPHSAPPSVYPQQHFNMLAQQLPSPSTFKPLYNYQAVAQPYSQPITALDAHSRAQYQHQQQISVQQPIQYMDNTSNPRALQQTFSADAQPIQAGPEHGGITSYTSPQLMTAYDAQQHQQQLHRMGMHGQDSQSTIIHNVNMPGTAYGLDESQHQS